MSVQLCLALLALSSLTAASDPDCDELTKPLEDRSKIHGKWIFHVGTSDSEEQLKAMKSIYSSWMELSPLPGSDEFSLRYGDKYDGKCYYGTVNSTTSGNSVKVTFYFNSSACEHVGKHLVTCPDCAVWTDETTSEVNGETKRSKSIYLFTRTGKLDPSHLEDFKKQAECLDFSSEFHYPETTNLCPDEQEAAADVKTEEQ
ncbi:uncharacterized protein LOC121649107 [Melanotaenia boesemani]|uniref:uncharacterized protein LOC121649107 n=1 Tax=Melanotaenia boesemani TaxID=1250792 RepID=UPI001C046605|nr:uncharacterized protein LOC121649107 [Melanotaenia boesemani]